MAGGEPAFVTGELKMSRKENHSYESKHPDTVKATSMYTQLHLLNQMQPNHPQNLPSASEKPGHQAASGKRRRTKELASAVSSPHAGTGVT